MDAMGTSGPATPQGMAPATPHGTFYTISANQLQQLEKMQGWMGTLMMRLSDQQDELNDALWWLGDLTQSLQLTEFTA